MKKSKCVKKVVYHFCFIYLKHPLWKMNRVRQDMITFCKKVWSLVLGEDSSKSFHLKTVKRWLWKMEREELKKKKEKATFFCTRVSPPHLFFVSRIFYGNSFLGATFLHNDVDDDSTSICVCTTYHSKV